MSTHQTIKLQAYLADCGVASRRKSEELIEAGKISVNGIVAHLGQRITPGVDTITFQGKIVTPSTQKVYLALNKPPGVISTTSDPEGRKTVINLLPSSLRQENLHLIGRLDEASEGLIIVTNDGDLTYRVTHPKFEIPKTYRILLNGIPSTPALNHLRRGVKLAERYIVPNEVKILGHEAQQQTWLEVTVSEGQKHLVRKMMRRIGYEVIRLIRTQIGALELGNLAPRQYRELTPEEIKKLTLD